MNKLRLITLFLLFAFLLQGCSKDTVTVTTSSNAKLQALVNGYTWLPDTSTTSVTYNAAAKTKTFYCSGNNNSNQLIFSVTVKNASSSAGFPIGTYTVDGNNITMQFNQQKLNSAGQLVYVQKGTVTPGSGVVIVTAIDSVNKAITGTFNFISRSNNYDAAGNLVSINVNEITGGAFNNLSYAFLNN